MIYVLKDKEGKEFKTKSELRVIISLLRRHFLVKRIKEGGDNQ
jgi:hypothetical protein